MASETLLLGMSDQPENRRIKSLLRANEIIERLRRTDGATLTEIADDVGLSPGSVHTYLSTLEDLGYVVTSDGQYELGPEFVTLGEYVRNQSPLYRAAKAEVDKLAEKTSEAVHLVVEHDGRGIALYERFGDEAVGTDYHRKLRQHPHQHLHCTASGKAILAELPDDRVDEIIDEHGLAVQTPNTITSRGQLFEELATIRERGHAVNDEEEVLGIVAVGAAICDQHGDVLGSVAVSTPKMRMEQEAARAEITEAVKRVANVVEVDFQTEGLL